MMKNQTTQPITDTQPIEAEKFRTLRVDFFKLTFGVETLKQIQALFISELEALTKGKAKEYLNMDFLARKYLTAIHFGYTINSIRNNLVSFKNAIELSNTPKNHKTSMLECFDFPILYKSITAKDTEQKKTFVQDMEDGKTLTIPLKEFSAKAEELKEILDKKSYIVKSNQDEKQVRAYHLLAFVSIVGGRRFTENLLTLRLEKIKNQTYFIGLLKGNGRDENIKAHLIPRFSKKGNQVSYLSIYKVFLKELQDWTIKDFHNLKQNEPLPTDIDLTISNAQINARYQKVFTNALRRYDLPNAKELRSEYSKTLSEELQGVGVGVPKDETKLDCISRLLGHTTKLPASTNYAK